MDSDVLVVGAGLAGLRCAGLLRKRGHAVQILEASSEPGGRMKTEQVDGFLIDRGFQVLSPAYPALKRAVDIDALDLRPFAPGLGVRDDDGFHTLLDPRAKPSAFRELWRSDLFTPREVIAATRWLAPALTRPQASLRQRDAKLSQALRNFPPGKMRPILERFAAGLVAETYAETSANLIRLYLRSMILGVPGVPTHGMQTLPKLLAEGLDIAYERRVDGVQTSDGSVAVMTDSGVIRARAVVVATDQETANDLVETGTTTPRGLSTWWFDLPRVDMPSLISIDIRGVVVPGPVCNTAVVSTAAPTYAPPGRSLIQATTLHQRGRATESEVSSHTADILGVSVADMTLVRMHDIGDALPAARPPLRHLESVDLENGLFVCGDHRDTPSTQGALVSGERAAKAVHAYLAG